MTTSFAITRHPLKDIKFMQDNTEMVLDVQDDITPKESAHLAIMFAIAVGSSSTLALWDYLGYINDKNLTRHFQFTEKSK